MNKESNAEHFNISMPDGLGLELNPDGTIKKIDAPKAEVMKWREVRLEYTESLGDAYKSLTIETFLTFDELTKLRFEGGLKVVSDE